MEHRTENVYIIQPIENEHYKILQEEAVSLIESAGAEYAGTIYQNIREINPATYIGEGKLEELKDRLNGLDVTVLFNGDLSPSQTLNISAVLDGKKVIDRTTLILDIFAQRAQSSEGKLQVELAQLNYIYPRLRGKGASLSRLGGGIGTRGPGETQLETDRRHIRSRIQALKERLNEVEQRRKLQTERRKKELVRTIALVGYTNTGKSTLLNALTDSDVKTRNALFETLDPTARKFEIDGVPFLLVDTVGFLQNLPHHLIQAFRSTLESALNCDLALIVCDASGEYDMQWKTTMETLQSMNFSSPYLVVMNKCDRNSDFRMSDAIAVSAKEKRGFDLLKSRILQRFENELKRRTLFIPYTKIKEYSALRNLLTEVRTEYTDDGWKVEAVIPTIYAEKFTEFIKN